MPRISVTKEIEISASHWLPGHATCGAVHGHNYRIQVTLTGETLRDGMLLDFAVLKDALKRRVEQPMDHRMLNKLTECPTAEWMAQWIFEQMAEYFVGNDRGLRVYRVRVWETSTSFATYEED